MTRFSANLGFLWTDLPLPGAIRAAHAAGYDAVECHWPYDTPAEAVRAALRDTGLDMLGLNTRRGGTGENGLSALPGREAEARAAIDESVAYARAIGCGAVHVMAGRAAGPEAEATFRANLSYAAAQAPDLTLLIEPLNRRDAPGYFLSGSDQAAALIGGLGLPNLRMMFDCYHVQIMEGDLTRRIERHLDLIGHLQIAAVPDRDRPDRGEVDYRHICRHLAALGWDRPIGAEYRPGAEGSGRDWVAALIG